MNNCDKGEAEVKGCLYFTISKLFRIVNKVAEESFNKMDICPTHGFLMVLLQEDEEGLSVNKISETLTIAPSTVTRFVDKLVSKGYVERIKTGKQSFTKMTKEGKKIMPEVYACWGEIFKKVQSMAGDKEYLDEVSKVITNFAELMEENQKNL